MKFDQFASRFTKLIALTHSDNDNEALVALRKAQQLAHTEFKLKLDDFFNASLNENKPNKEQDKTNPSGLPDELKGCSKAEIIELFDDLIALTNENDRDDSFLRSLRSQFTTRGKLSERQWECFLSALDAEDLI